MECSHQYLEETREREREREREKGGETYHEEGVLRNANV